MLLRSLSIPKSDFEAGTGWTLKPEGACKGPICIPLSTPVADTLDAGAIAKDLGMALVAEPAAGLWALGPITLGNRALATAEAADLRLPDVDGNEFSLASLRGQKVLLYAWAPY